MITRKNSTPILLLTGFLGAGKTTLLNTILKNNQGLKIGVIINDFGDINIDSMLVSAQTDTQLELSNGCICCSIDEGDLDDAISQLAHRGSLLDYIIIEASGLAEPKDLATMLRLNRNEYAHFDSLVTVIDAENFERNNETHTTAIDNMAIADIIIINKVDLVPTAKIREIEQGIAMVAPKARIIHAEYGMVDARLLLNDVATTKSRSSSGEQMSLANNEHEHEHPHLHDSFQSISFTTQKPLDPVLFESWAQNLPNNIFRAKGICYFGMKGVDQKFIFQAVGKRYTLKLDEWQSHETIETNLVVIGTDLNESAVRKELEDLIDASPDNLNADTLMDIFKYK